MKRRILPVGMVLACAGIANADFAPINLSSGSYSQDMVIEQNAPHAPTTLNGNYTTASMDDGVNNDGYSWYEKGYNTTAPTTGLPAAGSTFVSGTHSYKMAASYSANNAVLVDSTHNGSLILTTPANYSALSLLVSAGHGPVTVDFVVHHADSSAESGSFNASDWFGGSAAYIANGRVDVVSAVFDNVDNGQPRLYSVDIPVSYGSSPITSVDLNWNAGNTGSGAAAIFALSGQVLSPVTLGQSIQWGLTIANINNPITPRVGTNSDGSLTITAGGGDTYTSPDSFTYAYQQVTGDFDIKVRVNNVTATDPAGQDSPKGSLMARANLTQGAANIQISALPLAPSGRLGQIESIARLHDISHSPADTGDINGTQPTSATPWNVTDTVPNGACTYPDVWLRIQRQGDKFMTYFANVNPSTGVHSSDTGSYQIGTNGWQLLAVVPAGPDFPKTMYVGLSTVAHNGDPNDANHAVTVNYSSYGNTPSTPSTPNANGVAVAANQAPGAFPNKSVMGINWDISLPANGQGYPADVVQSSQGAASPIIWNSGGFGSVSRDIILNIDSETPGGFSVARYQAGALDFLLSPRDPVLAQQNLGPYSNPNRKRIANGDPTVPAAQAYFPSPGHGFVMSTVRKNGQAWNDQSPSFYAATYVQLDGVGSAMGYDMTGGNFRNAHFYTRTTKIATGVINNGVSDLSGLQRCAIPISVAWFPFDQGWKAGYFESSDSIDSTLSIPDSPKFKWNNGWGLFSGTVATGITNQLLPAMDLLTWQDVGYGPTISGLAKLALPGVNSLTDGMLFTVGNDEGNSVRGPAANNAALADGSGWQVAVRGIEESKYDPNTYAMPGIVGSSFSFLFIPWNADNLIGAHIRGTDGAVLHGAGSFTVTRLSTGRYALSIPGKTGTNGMLMLVNSGYLASQPTVVDTALLSYEYGGTNTPANSFIIESRYLNPGVGPSGEDIASLRDADFNFAWVDFQNPLSPPGTAKPVLRITRSGSNITVSWTGGAGYTLETTGSLSGTPTWTGLGTTNPHVLPIGSGNQFFRVVSP